MQDLEYSLEDIEFIELNKLLQIMGLVNSGGEAKMFILEGEVLLNGELCEIIRKKIYPGDEVIFNEQRIKVLSDLDLELISILMPVKNAEKWLKECLDSIVRQTEKHWELIAINDHSDDASESILQTYAKTDKRIRVLDNDGQGIISALRLAYAHSKGNFITRMDADDVMMEEKLSLMKQDLKSSGRGHLAQGQVKYISEKTIGDGYATYEKWLNSLIQQGKNWNDLYKECVIASPCWMVHRADLERANAFLPDTYPEDYDLTFRFYASGLKMIPSSSVLHHWRDYPERTSRTSEVYADNKFTELKVLWLKRLHLNSERPLVLWGAGTRGKAISAELLSYDIMFYWLTNNPKKIGANIYGLILGEEKDLSSFKNPQVIIAISNKDSQAYAVSVLKDLGLKTIEDYYVFC